MFKDPCPGLAHVGSAAGILWDEKDFAASYFFGDCFLKIIQEKKI